MFKGKVLLLAKVETVYGTDAAPVPGTDAILTEQPEVEIVSRGIERANTRSFLGAFPRITVGEAVKIKFATEIKGSGTATTPPEIGKLFRGCGYTQTIGASYVDYDPNSNLLTAESLTIWYYFDGMAHKVTGCRGTFTVDLKAGEYGKINWEFTGIYQKAADLALTTGTYVTATVPPKFVSASFAIDSYAAIIEAIKINAGNEIAKRVSANAATGILEYFINKRNITGDIDPELVTITTKDFWSTFDTSSQVAFTATLGSSAGNRLVISGSNVQLTDLKYGDRDGLMTYQFPLSFVPGSSGNDEIKFKFS
jgi:hypothetical protein